MRCGKEIQEVSRGAAIRCDWCRPPRAPAGWPSGGLGGAGIPPPLDLVVGFLCHEVPLSATIGRLVPARAPFFAPFSASDPPHFQRPPRLSAPQVTPNATSGRHLGQFRARDCAMQPVPLVGEGSSRLERSHMLVRVGYERVA